MSELSLVASHLSLLLLAKFPRRNPWFAKSEKALCELIQFQNFQLKKKLQQVNILIYTSYKGYYSGIIALSLYHPVERNISLNKFASMSYYEDAYDEQYEEYYKRYEEEEILYVDGDILKHEYDEDY